MTRCDDPEQVWTPETLNGEATRLHSLYTDWLVADEDALCPLAGEHLMMAIGLLNQAQAQLRIAALHQTAAIAAKRIG